MPKSAKAFREYLKKSGVFYTPKKLDEFMRSFFPKDVPEIYVDDLQNVLNEAKRKLAEKGIHRKI